MKYTLIIFITLFFGKCSPRYWTEDLHFEKIDNHTEKLSLNGYFFNKSELAYFFFFENGVTMTGNGFGGTIEEFEAYYSDYENYKTKYNIAYKWGLYRILEDDIEISSWTSGNTLTKYSAKLSQGKILSKDKFVLNHYIPSIGKDTFYFKEYSPKPDSTNMFIN